VPSASTLAAFAAASLVLLVIPGPAVLYIVNHSVSDGRRVGLAAVAGVTLGNLTHAVAAAAGLTAVLATSATAFSTVKWLGAGYLVWVGVRTLVRPAAALDADRAGVSTRRAFLRGVVVNVLNPKVALFFLSFLPQFVHPGDGRPGLQALVLGLVFVLLGACTDSTYSLLASTLRDTLLRGRALPFVQRWVAGTVFVVLGVLAAGASATSATSAATATARPAGA
jgi:threonine/homoserine/homoserine lactone efflux protein